MIKLKVPEGGTGCSFEGEEYEADAAGVVEVPEESVSVLMSHGFTVAAPEAPKKDEPKKDAKK